MKKSTVLFIALISFAQINFAQIINLELADPHPELQNADTGDMEFADIDNDGDFDLILTGSGNGQVALTTLYRNDGAGNFSEITGDNIEDVRASKVGFSDFDNDGDLDLIISGQTHGGIFSHKLYFNDGSGDFTLDSTAPFDNSVIGTFAIGDVDNDSDDDILILGSNGSGEPTTKFYQNDGTGSFSEVSGIGIESVTGVAKFFDYDNDNDLDLILTGENLSSDFFTGLYSNDGNGIFSLVANPGFKGFSGGDVAIGDSDGDGDLDVLICGNLTNVDIETELYINDGAGAFTLKENTTISDVSASGEASFNDFDNDGDLDVFVLGSGEGGLATNAIVGNIYENQGSNNFVISDSLIGGYLSSHAVADIDGDNDLDLVLGGTTIGSPVRATWLYLNVTPITVNTEELTTLNNIELYPNPSNGILNIKLKETSEITITIYSQLGQLLYSDYIENDDTQIQLDFPSGIYYAILRNNESVQTEKLILRRE